MTKQGFHIKYRIYGSSAEPAAKVAAKSTPKKKPVKKQAKPVVRNNSGRTQLSIKKMPQVAMKSAPIAKQPGVELGGIEKHIGLNIEMQGTGYYILLISIHIVSVQLIFLTHVGVRIDVMT